MSRRAARRWFAGLAAIIGMGVGGSLLFERFIGFARQPIAHDLPPDVHAFVSVRHIRQIAIAASISNRTSAAYELAQGAAQLFLARFDVNLAPIDPEDQERMSGAFADLAGFFKTEFAAALLPGPIPLSKGGKAEIALIARFSGSEDALFQTFVQLAPALGVATRADQWSSEDWEGIRLRSLRADFPPAAAKGLARFVNSAPLQPAWCVDRGLFFAARNPDVLKELVLRSRSALIGASLADQVAFQELERFAPQQDFVAYAAIPELLAMGLHHAQAALKAGPHASYAPLVSLPKLASELGVDQWDSLIFAQEASGSATSYLGLRYRDRRGLLGLLHPGQTIRESRGSNCELGLSETLAIDAGELGLSLKNAVQRAAPASGLFYFKLRSEFLAATGLDLDAALAGSFEIGLSGEAGIDIGTIRRGDGRIAQAVALDAALSLPVKPNSPMAAALAIHFDQWQRQYPNTLDRETNAERDLLMGSWDEDATLTARQFGIAIEADRIAIGFGTLKSLLDPNIATQPIALAERSVGKGALRIEGLSRQIERLAPTLFRQLYPDESLPAELLDFDWSQFDVLALRREAETVDDGVGHLYRTSRLATD